MDSPEISQIKAAIEALKTLVYWHEYWRQEDPSRQADAAIEAQNAIDDLLQSDAIQKFSNPTLLR